LFILVWLWRVYETVISSVERGVVVEFVMFIIFVVFLIPLILLMMWYLNPHIIEKLLRLQN